MVSIIIPNYNGKHYLQACLTSVFKSIDSTNEVIVVDNGSSDGSIEFIKERFPEIVVIENDANLGFSPAVNIGIKASRNPFVYLLNNDTEVEMNFLQSPLELIKNNKSIFSVNSLMLNYYDRNQIDGAGDGMTIFGWPYRQDRDSGIENLSTKRVFSSCAGAALYRKDMLEELGMFDDHFFAYLEDVDLGFRANLYGYKNFVDVDSVVYHVENGTSGKGENEFKTKLAGRNSIYLIYKNFPVILILLNLPFLFIGYILRLIKYSSKGFGILYLQSMVRGLKTTKDVRRQKISFNRMTIYIKIELVTFGYKNETYEKNGIKYTVLKRMKFGKILFPFEELSKIKTEKGSYTIEDENKWQEDSLFGIIDNSGRNSSLNRIFGNDINTMVCDDGCINEIADFICASTDNNKVIFSFVIVIPPK